ncbi:MAG: Hint domain-containing protein [Pseudomonadota bacterium]
MSEEIWDMTTTGYGPSTVIDTTEGPVPVEWLSRTHRVITRDDGAQPVLSIEKHILHPEGGAYVPLVALDPPDGTEEYPLILPPSHQVFVDGPEVSLNFGFKAGLCQSGFLVGARGIHRFNSGASVAFYTVLTPAHSVLRANGHWVETFQISNACPRPGAEPLPPQVLNQLTLVNGAHVPPYPCLSAWEGRLVARAQLADKPRRFASAA